MRAADQISTGAIVIAVLGIALTLGVNSASAESNNVVLRQVTNLTTGNIASAKLRMQDGNDIAFVSTGDVMGTGTATALRQVYLWREQLDGTGVITRVTPNNACESYDASRGTDTTLSDRPEIIAFVSTCDYDPQGDNSDHNPEIFFYDVDTSRFHQITDTPSTVINAEPFASDSGRCVVFRSNGNIDNNTPSNPHYDVSHPGPGFSNPDGSNEIFFYGKINGGTDFPQNAVFTQVSNGPAGTTSSHPVVNGYYFPRQCSTVAFQSDYNQLATGVTGQLIWIYNTPSSALEEIAAAEIPHGWPAGTYRNPMISGASPFARGPHIVFEAVPDLWNNLSTGVNLFDWRAFHPRMTQYTNVGTGSAISEPQVGDGGGVISFNSNGELLSQKHAARTGELPPFNADGNSEIFRLKGRRRVAQLTQTSACQNLHSSLKDDGKRLAFISTCDLIPGENPTHKPQVFLWGLEKSDFPLLKPGECLQSAGCCLDTPKQQTCYHVIEGKKPKINRPNCVERDACD